MIDDVSLFYQDLKGYPRKDLLRLAGRYGISEQLNNKSLAREIAKIHSKGIMQTGRMLFKTDCVNDVKKELDIIQALIKSADEKTASDSLKSALLIQQGEFKKGCEELLKTAKSVRKEIERAIGIDIAARKQIPGIPVQETPTPKAPPPKKPMPKVLPSPKAPKAVAKAWEWSPAPKSPPPFVPPKEEKLECTDDTDCREFIKEGKLSTKCTQQPVVCVELKDGKKHCYHSISKVVKLE